jgi:hypothetical protein
VSKENKCKERRGGRLATRCLTFAAPAGGGGAGVAGLPAVKESSNYKESKR